MSASPSSERNPNNTAEAARLSRPRRIAHWLLLGTLGILLLALAFYFRAPLQTQLTRAANWINTLGPWAPIVFIIIYALGSTCFIPGSVLTLSAGWIFGLVAGTIYVSIGATLGAALSFIIGRHFARDWVSQKLGKNQVFEALNHATAREGWKVVGLVRLAPIFPFALVNYGFGLTRVPLVQYVLATCSCMIPWTIVYVYLGSLVNVNTTAAGPWKITLRIIGLVVTLLVTVLLTRIARRALSEKLSANNV
jgi:uncharacterized membrane protein YdjX (TVP38/TMEM64 family)